MFKLSVPCRSRRFKTFGELIGFLIDHVDEYKGCIIEIFVDDKLFCKIHPYDGLCRSLKFKEFGILSPEIEINYRGILGQVAQGYVLD